MASPTARAAAGPAVTTGGGVGPGTASAARRPHPAERPERRAKTKPPYPAEFKREAVRLVREGRTGSTGGTSAAQVARELGVSPDTLRAWVKQTEIDAGDRDGLTTDERQELGHLRREVKRLQEEREILKKATAFFAAESATR